MMCTLEIWCAALHRLCAVVQHSLNKSMYGVKYPAYAARL